MKKKRLTINLGRNKIRNKPPIQINELYADDTEGNTKNTKDIIKIQTKCIYDKFHTDGAGPTFDVENHHRNSTKIRQGSKLQTYLST